MHFNKYYSDAINDWHTIYAAEEIFHKNSIAFVNCLIVITRRGVIVYVKHTDKPKMHFNKNYPFTKAAKKNGTLEVSDDRHFASYIFCSHHINKLLKLYMQ